MKSDIPVVIADKVTKTSVLINPGAPSADRFDPATGETIESNNILAEGSSSREVLKKVYG
jgi:hypothetical protein